LGRERHGSARHVAIKVLIVEAGAFRTNFAADALFDHDRIRKHSACGWDRVAL
jgi:hypothetical protein